MVFLRVYNLTSLIPPGRLYDHAGGSEVFSNGENSVSYTSRQESWLAEENLDYFIAISWGENGQKVLDIFGYLGLRDNWKANPEVQNWVVKDGILVQKKEITCGESLVLLGREEEHRLKTEGLEEYLSKPLDINKINKIIIRS